MGVRLLRMGGLVQVRDCHPAGSDSFLMGLLSSYDTERMEARTRGIMYGIAALKVREQLRVEDKWITREGTLFYSLETPHSTLFNLTKEIVTEMTMKNDTSMTQRHEDRIQSILHGHFF